MTVRYCGKESVKAKRCAVGEPASSLIERMPAIKSWAQGPVKIRPKLVYRREGPAIAQVNCPGDYEVVSLLRISMRIQ